MLTINNTIDGAIQDIEIKGNTVQDPDNLADIKSVGELQEDGTYKMSILSCGKNLFDKNAILKDVDLNGTDGFEFSKVGTHTSDYIEVREGQTLIRNLGTWYFTYNNNKEFLGVVSGNTKYIVASKVKYVRITVTNENLNTFQLEEGTQSTPYEPYQGNKCDILLPCQLEKVGDVSDRLYYDDVEKAWCIEKNIETLIINGTKQNAYVITGNTDTDFIKIGYKLTEDTYDKYKGVIANIKSILSCESEVKFKNNSLNTECVSLYNGGNTYSIYLSLSKAKYGDNLKSVLNKLEEDNLYLYVVRLTPQKIILPLSTQIVLNSFFGTTHIYMESGEVEGTIKCKIPKSLGATVQSLNNKTDILSDRIEAIEGLKDSQNMKYETDKGYLVCKETKNGVIDDLKIEGKTLVNLFNNSTVKLQEAQNRLQCVNDENIGLYKKGVYTIVNLCDKTVTPNIYTTNPKTWIKALNVPGNSSITINLEENQSICEVVWFYSFGWTSSDLDKVRNGLVILEGDHTQNPPSYFEGLMSVGQDVDKIEVLSCNGNLITNDFELGDIAWGTGLPIEANLDTRIRVVDFINVLSNVTYSLNVDGCISANVYFYTSEKKFINPITVTKTNYTFKTPYNCAFIKIMFVNNGKQLNPVLNIGDTLKPYIPHQSDKKQILFYNENGELEPIQELHEWDSIEKHSDNKWYYHKRSGKVVLNGSENWINQSNSDILLFYLNMPEAKGNQFKLKTTYINLGSSDTNNENIQINSLKNLIITINSTKLSTQDVTGFKQWLQANNVTVVYQLAQEEVYELAPLHLDSYANETLILCNSGAISPKMEFSITSHINELVKAYGERINLLEEKVYKYMVTQNRMQLASTYSADSVTFKVDYFSLCGDEENYDEDLYNLILNNILVGKDNYNYDKMFTIILDYASWDQISWEQFDILVGLMDIQHNPPVEELPPEDEIEEDIIEEDIIENEETPVE